nr:hypothetical protein [Armatimonadota bacterium]NIM23921.1 hypothetical protein [Armatimonadota bacterium]NIM67768.1 hypothetical protein [Armatimonadota bacterium]NIM76308.1 hypothetical protein [Armatimonadota bacterium]NIN06002.1 hypothetical protein [Armatimonadota bacterium]
LQAVCKQEKLQAEDAALSLLAHAAEGSARDALSLLEQAAAFADKSITVNDTRAILGGIEPELLIEFADLLAKREVDGLFALIDRVVAEGKDLVQLIKELIKHLRDLLIIKITDKGREGDLAQIEISLPREYLPQLRRQAGEITQKHLLEMVDLLCQAEGELRFSGQQRLLLELCAARACGIGTGEGPLLEQPAQEVAAKQPTPTKQTTKKAAMPAGGIEEIREKWPDMLEALKTEKQVALRSLAQDATISKFKENVLTLTFTSEFNCAEISKHEKKALLEKVLEKVLGRRVRIECALRGGPSEPVPAGDDSALSEALDMFPGSEVL